MAVGSSSSSFSSIREIDELFGYRLEINLFGHEMSAAPVDGRGHCPIHPLSQLLRDVVRRRPGFQLARFHPSRRDRVCVCVCECVWVFSWVRTTKTMIKGLLFRLLRVWGVSAAARNGICVDRECVRASVGGDPLSDDDDDEKRSYYIFVRCCCWMRVCFRCCCCACNGILLLMC